MSEGWEYPLFTLRANAETPPTTSQKTPLDRFLHANDLPYSFFPIFDDSRILTDGRATMDEVSRSDEPHSVVPPNANVAYAEYAQSEYFSVRSTAAATFISQTDSTGLQSQHGATWLGAMAVTMNSGFASGTPRTENRKGVREGRERETGLLHVRAVGRIGKAPALVPQAMVEAMRSGELQPQRAQNREVVGASEPPTEGELEDDHWIDEDATPSELTSEHIAVSDGILNFKAKSKDEFETSC